MVSMLARMSLRAEFTAARICRVASLIASWVLPALAHELTALIAVVMTLVHSIAACAGRAPDGTTTAMDMIEAVAKRASLDRIPFPSRLGSHHRP